jgi:hypothetical protein
MVAVLAVVASGDSGLGADQGGQCAPSPWQWLHPHVPHGLGMVCRNTGGWVTQKQRPPSGSGVLQRTCMAVAVALVCRAEAGRGEMQSRMPSFVGWAKHRT